LNFITTAVNFGYMWAWD